MDTKTSITVGALIQGFFTLLSRIAGMARDLMISHIFGASIFTDAFWVAFTIPNVLRQFFAEGSFGVSFVPVFVSTKEKEGENKAKIFFKNAFGFLLVGLCFITILGILCSKFLVYLFAFGFKENIFQFELTTKLTKAMFSYVFFVSLVALFGAYLQCYRKYAAMSFAPILLNISMIFTMLLAEKSQFFEVGIWSLPFGVILGGILQVFMMYATLKWHNLFLRPGFDFKNKEMKRFGALLLPGLFGIIIYQLNIVVIRQLASFLGEGQLSYYYNADRLTQFAIGVFGASIANASLPEFSLNFSKKGKDGLIETLKYSFSITSFIITPCAIGLLFFAKPVISVLFLHGAFNVSDMEETAKTLMAFAPSLIPFCLSRFIIQGFYTIGDTKLPVKLGVISLVLNFLIGFGLISFKVQGLAFTISISSSIQFLALFYFFRKNLKLPKLGFVKIFMKHALISFISCLPGLILMRYGEWHEGPSFVNMIVLALICFLSATVYFITSFLFGLSEAKKIVEFGLKLLHKS